jgi:hypothetical protein
MNTLYVLAAACLMGQTSDPAPAPAAPPAPEQQHRILFPRLHALFHPAENNSTPAAKVPAPPRPVRQNQPARENQPTLVTVSNVVQQRYADRIGHEDDYSWITGELYHVNADGGHWVVRYATANTQDKFHGNVVLPPDVNMRNFRAGDLVSIHGEILNNGFPSRIGEAPYYKVNSIDVIERID